MDTKICEVCGGNFNKKTTESKKYWATKKYCSPKCSLTKTAAQFQPNPFRFKKGVATWNKGLKFTAEQKSKSDLSGLALGRLKGKKGNIGKENKRWTSIEKTCIICQKIFNAQPYRAKTARFCSYVCYHKWHIGRNSPVWTDNYKRRFRQRIMELREYKEWRLEVFKRDNFTCVRCGTLRKNIEADHIIAFRTLIEQFKIVDIDMARNCKELWDISNGRTLCKSCHRKTETYGNKKLNIKYE